MVKYREAELKHGRVAMLAITGMLFAEVWHPMLAATTNVPAIYGFQATLQQSVILAPVLAGIAAVETASFPGWEPTDFKMKEGAVPGSYANVEGASPWTKDKLSPEEYERKEVVELNNGRLAMLACVGLWAQELIQQQPVMYTLLEKLGAEQPEIITLVNTGSF
ncbi:chlorophyll A-B binding protein [Aureococcus anophagefferens]|nr:chlorophyll A-B binding protein [Aureococcus anophagefferens]